MSTDETAADPSTYEWTPEPPAAPPAWQDDYTPSSALGAHLEAINAKQIAQLEMEAAALTHHRNPTPATEQALDHYATQFGRAVARLHMYHLNSITSRKS